MDKSKQELKGSPSRDMFKYWHKKLSKYLYACDIDFTLVAKCRSDRRRDHVVGILDYKESNDNVTFTEAIAYNNFIAAGFPVYLVRSTCIDPPLQPCTCECTCGADDVQRERMEQSKFIIYKILSCDPRKNPPTCELDRDCVTFTDSWEEFEEWEEELRNTRLREICEGRGRQDAT